MKAVRRVDRRVVLLASAAVVVLGAGSTALAAANGAFSSDPADASGPCSAPGLDGSVVEVSASDLSGMMHGPEQSVPGSMRLVITPSTVRRGVVSLDVANDGALKHEVVVLPLAGDRQVGARPVGPGGTVDTSGSLGEASRNCGPGKGDGIDPASHGWVTLTLPAGRYELLSNRPGQYDAGMFAELDVTDPP
jgi:uncharacterized cupredoxin-like copper-binding protein